MKVDWRTLILDGDVGKVISHILGRMSSLGDLCLRRGEEGNTVGGIGIFPALKVDITHAPGSVVLIFSHNQSSRISSQRYSRSGGGYGMQFIMRKRGMVVS